MDVKQHLIDQLESFGFPVYLQGAMSRDEEYPPDFFTFWNNETWGAGFFNDEATRTVWDFDVNFYSDDPAHVSDYMAQARVKLKNAGFTVVGKGYDVLSDEASHTGRGMNVLFMEKEE